MIWKLYRIWNTVQGINGVLMIILYNYVKLCALEGLLEVFYNLTED